MTDDTRFELAGEQSRHETAALLRKLANDLDGGRELVFDDSVALPVPETLDVEVDVEVEAETDAPDEYEVDVELEWDDDAVAAAESPGTERTEASEGGAESETEPRPAIARPEVEHVEEGPTARASPPEDEAVPEQEEGVPEEPTLAEPGVEAEPAERTPLARFQVYRDRGGKWRWRLVHRNGNIVASSAQGYTTKRNAEKGMRSVVQNAPNATVEREGR
ncbi:amphi-Trp domain-containing protein [Halospeciosus flavus]|uniref:amphi-Trp domain-containing protein n=1 Tax=Halospeciosus flavus TaxID=3032283 RepID=UPI00360D1ECA